MDRRLWADSAVQLNSMLGSTVVLTEHIVYRTLSTSLTLFPAPFTAEVKLDAVEGKVSDGRKEEFHPGVGGRG